SPYGPAPMITRSTLLIFPLVVRSHSGRRNFYYTNAVQLVKDTKSWPPWLSPRTLGSILPCVISNGPLTQGGLKAMMVMEFSWQYFNIPLSIVLSIKL